MNLILSWRQEAPTLPFKCGDVWMRHVIFRVASLSRFDFGEKPALLVMHIVQIQGIRFGSCLKMLVMSLKHYSSVYCAYSRFSARDQNFMAALVREINPQLPAWNSVENEKLSSQFACSIVLLCLYMFGSLSESDPPDANLTQ